MSTELSLFVVTIAGISGKLGRIITRHLLSNPNIHINGLTRDPSKAPQELRDNPRIALFPNDSPTQANSLRAAVKGASIVICTYLGTPEFERDGQIALLDASIAEGVPRFLTSDFTVDWRKVPDKEFPQKKANREVNAYVEEKEKHGQIEGVRILVGAFMESLFSYGFFWFGPGEQAGIKYWGTGDETWEIASYDTIARYIAEVAVDETATGWLQFLGDRKTTKEIKATVEEVYGTDVVVPMTRLGSFQELIKSFEDGYAKDPDDRGFDLWKRSAYIINLTSDKTYLNQPLDNEKYPNVQPETLKDWLQHFKIDDLQKTAFF